MTPEQEKTALDRSPVNWRRLAANLLRTTQVATGRIVPLTSLLSLLDLVVVAEVEPLQTSARITHLEIGRVAIVSRCDVVGDVAELSVVGSVEGTAQFGLPLERCLRHWRDYSNHNCSALSLPEDSPATTLNFTE